MKFFGSGHHEKLPVLGCAWVVGLTPVLVAQPSCLMTGSVLRHKVTHHNLCGMESFDGDKSSKVYKWHPNSPYK